MKYLFSRHLPQNCPLTPIHSPLLQIVFISTVFCLHWWQVVPNLLLFRTLSNKLFGIHNPTLESLVPSALLIPTLFQHTFGNIFWHQKSHIGILPMPPFSDILFLFPRIITKNFIDLRLAAQCLGLQWVEEGRHWDRVNRRYRDVAVLGIFGEVETVDTVIGRLELMA